MGVEPQPPTRHLFISRVFYFMLDVPAAADGAIPFRIIRETLAWDQICKSVNMDAIAKMSVRCGLCGITMDTCEHSQSE